jgi:putative membrane protein
MRKHLQFLSALAATSTLLLGVSLLQGQGDPQGKESYDTRILSKMHHINHEEIEAGKMALERSQSLGVRNYGQRLYQDHQMSDKQLKELAKRKGIQLSTPEPMTAAEKKHKEESKQVMQKLMTLKGANFDRLFVEHMRKGHEHAITLVKEAATKVQDTEVRSFLQQTLPTLIEHRDMAARLQQQADKE